MCGISKSRMYEGARLFKALHVMSRILIAFIRMKFTDHRDAEM